MDNRVKDLEFAVDKLSKFKNEPSDFPYGALSAPFSKYDLEWRVNRSGLSDGGPWAVVVPYIQVRAIYHRLDEVIGAPYWQNEIQMTEKGVISSLGIKVHGEWIWKKDGSDFTDIESFKGGISGALKRAAVLWGMGRYLYEMPKTYARFVPESTEGALFAKIGGKDYYWIPDVGNSPSAASAPPTPLKESKAIVKSERPSDGNYRIDLGKSNDLTNKTLGECSIRDIESNYSYWFNQSKLKKITGKPADFIVHAKAYLDAYYADTKKSVSDKEPPENISEDMDIRF